ncbi:dicarboxylate transporter/tellurite-resistance protein TehA [soil metagenome]
MGEPHVLDGDLAHDPQPRPSSLLSLFAIPLGVAGLAGVWQALRDNDSAPGWPAETFFAISATLWFGLSLTYLVIRGRGRGNFTADRTHSVFGPFAAYLPVVGLLISSHYVQYLPAARVVVALFVAALAYLVAQLVAYWLLGNLPAEALHPGYFLPTVAGAFIASIGLSFCGWPHAAMASFGVGIFFWLAIGTLIFNRLFTGPALPDSVKPTLSVLLSAPATAGIAWFLLNGAAVDTIAQLLLGVLAIMLAVQVVLIAEYRALSFSQGFWAFTFPVAASSNLVIRTLGATDWAPAGIGMWVIGSAATIFIATMTVASVIHAVRGARATATPTMSTR